MNLFFFYLYAWLIITAHQVSGLFSFFFLIHTHPISTVLKFPAGPRLCTATPSLLCKRCRSVFVIKFTQGQSRIRARLFVVPINRGLSNRIFTR